jgi:hypothetical protein
MDTSHLQEYRYIGTHFEIVYGQEAILLVHANLGAL